MARFTALAAQRAVGDARREVARNRERFVLDEPALQVLVALRRSAAGLAVEQVLAERTRLRLAELAVEVTRNERLGLIAVHGRHHSWPNSGCSWRSFSLNLARARNSRDSTVPIEM